MEKKTIDMWNGNKDKETDAPTQIGQDEKQEAAASERKGVYIKDLRAGQVVKGQFSVKIKKPVQEYKRGYRFELRVADRTGVIDIKYWGGAEKGRVEGIYAPFSVGDIVNVYGIVREWNNNLEIHVNEWDGQTVTPAKPEEYDVSDFIESVEDKGALLKELMELAGSVKDVHLKELLDRFFSDREFMAEFIDAPASVTHHSNLSGGLLHHTLKVVRIADSLCTEFPELNRDLVITGAILHDIGKAKEMKITTNINPTEDGTLLGHIYIGAGMVERWMDGIPEFPELLRRKMIHIILSHHGRMEYGSPKVPMFPEAEAVHLADNSEAMLEEILKRKRDANTEDPFVYVRGMGENGINLYLR